MTTSDDQYMLGSSEPETRRLARQAQLYGGTSFLEDFLTEQPRQVLDVGSGSGHIAQHVARRLPSAQVIGLDLDGSRVAFAREHASAPNLKFQQGDLCALPFEDDSFDLVYTRFVLIHDRDPARGLAEMARVTCPGGRVVAYDMIHEGVWFSPPKPAFRQILGQLIALLRERGAEPNQGLHLPLGLINAGLEEVQTQVIPHAAISDAPLFEAHRENWTETLATIEKTLGAQIDAPLLRAALRELEIEHELQFVVEITVMAHGRKAAR